MRGPDPSRTDHGPRDERGPWRLWAAIAARLGAASGDGIRDPGDGRAVRRVGLALDGGPLLAAWCERERVDAALVHRSRGATVPRGVALLGCHDAFDDVLGLHGVACARALGALGHQRLDPKLSLADGLDPARLATCFGHEPQWHGADARDRDPVHGRRVSTPGATPTRAALASALDPDRVRGAAERGAWVYVTGQWRPSAAEAVVESGCAVAVVGHRAAEAWALRRLAAWLREDLPEVTLRVRADEAAASR